MRVQREEGRDVDVREGFEEAESGKTRTGKLVRPRKKVREDGVVRQKEDGHAAAEQAGIAQDGPAEARRPSVSLSAYSFHGDSAPAPAVHANMGAPQPAKKAVRKRAPRNADAGDALVAKKPRKTKTSTSKAEAKSEAIILNSDEPDIPPAHDFEGSWEESAVAETVPKVKKARAKKAKDTGDKDAETTTKATKPRKTATETSEQSAYFATATAPLLAPASRHLSPHEPLTQDGTQRACSERDLPPTDLAAGAPPASPLPLAQAEPAPRRRRDWTPVKDSLHSHIDVVTTHPAEGNVAHDDSPAKIKQDTEDFPAPVPLAQLIGNFSYMQPPSEANDSGMVRTASGEAMTKRRKIELADAPILPAKANAKTTRAPKAPKEKVIKEKKPKSPKKKLQTITAMATAAYRPAAEAVMEGAAQGTVSEFFAPRKPSPPPAPAGPVVKKPRKPRAKKTDAEKPAAKTKAKSKVKFKEEVFRPPLLTPSQATKHLRTQDFLFGTSSQLAVEESPTFVRQMQVAVLESEAMAAGHSVALEGTQFVTQAETTPTKRSCARVPTAPHGTCLSLRQAERQLWCSGARDGKGGVMVREERVGVMMDREDDRSGRSPGLDDEHEATPGEAAPVQEDRHPVLEPAAQVRASLVTRSKSPPRKYALPGNRLGAHDKASPQFVDLSHTSPLAEDEVRLDDQGLHDSVMEGETLPEAHAVPDDDQDDWMLLRSEDSVMAPQPAHVITQERRPASPTHQAWSPSPTRTVLQPLDANVAMMAHEHFDKLSLPPDVRAFSTTTDTAAPRAKASKAKVRAPTRAASPAAEAEPPAAKRPRGRPRKDTAPTAAISPPKRLRGRPPKTAALHTSFSQPTEWTNIDQISDSEPDTPSPPRRRASAPPSPVAPLDFDIAPAPAPAPPAAKGKAVMLKPTDPEYLSLAPSLHRQITAKVREAGCSGQIHQPSWHEKILLYDPIVLEDFTAYLTSQGVRTSYTRLRPKSKPKGRPKKKDAEAGEVGKGDGLAQEEVVEGELKPWMVQKWCEENGVCCLWKEGLRGGVRGKY